MSEKDVSNLVSVHKTSSPSSLHCASVIVNSSFITSGNPSPARTDDTASLEFDYLSPNRLRELSGEDDLNRVTHLTLSINTQSGSLGNFGGSVPNLRELKCVDSSVPSVRDLGVGLGNITVLSLCQCGLQDIDGLPSLQSLQELYIAVNEVKDVSIVAMMFHLTVLDVQSNQLTDRDQLGYLGLCMKLSSLFLAGNPISLLLSSSNPGGYRAGVIESIPQLKLLDNVPVGVVTPPISPTPDLYQISSRDRPRTAVSPGTPVLSSEVSCVSPLSDDCSDLTHGVNEVMCGNPVRALKSRRRRGLVSQSLVISPATRPLTSPNSTRPFSDDIIEVTMATSEIDLSIPRPPTENRPVTSNYRHRKFRSSSHIPMTFDPIRSDHTPTTNIQ